MASLKERISQVLLSRGLVTEAQLAQAAAAQRDKGTSLQKVLIEQGLVSESDLLAAISQGLGIPPITLARYKLDPNLKALVPREIASQYELLPVSCIGQTLTVAMSDPLNLMALDTLTAMTGLSINPFIAGSKDIREAIDQYYGAGVEETLRTIVQKTEADALEFIAEKKETEESVGLSQIQEAPVVRYTDAILTSAVRMRASDLLIEPREQTVRIRYRVDGVLQEGKAPPKSLHAAIVSRLKVMSELNIAERRLPQDGHFTFRVDERLIDFRLSILPATFGSNVCVRVLDKGAIKLDIDTLGFDPDDLKRLKACAKRPHGLILATGPTGSGKTTTLYALLRMIESPDKNIVTVEDPVEFDLKGINQVGARPDIGLTFAAALRSILRQDPDVIMVGEIRDGETADMAVKSALTGHLVLTTLHTNTAVGSIVRLMNMGLEPFLINSCLMAVVGQRLVRRVCRRCAQPYEPSEGVAKRLGLPRPDGKSPQFVRPAGCRACFQSGYVGREVLAETLILTPEIRELILKRSVERDIEEMAKRQGMRGLRDLGLAKALAHVTTLEEVFRTTTGEVVG